MFGFGSRAAVEASAARPSGLPPTAGITTASALFGSGPAPDINVRLLAWRLVAFLGDRAVDGGENYGDCAPDGDASDKVLEDG